MLFIVFHPLPPPSPFPFPTCWRPLHRFNAPSAAAASRCDCVFHFSLLRAMLRGLYLQHPYWFLTKMIVRASHGFPGLQFRFPRAGPPTPIMRSFRAKSNWKPVILIGPCMVFKTCSATSGFRVGVRPFFREN